MSTPFQKHVNRSLGHLKRKIACRRWNTEIEDVSEPRTTGCEWCPRTTQIISVGFKKKNPKGPAFSEGFCNFGQIEYFEDRKFHLQSEWWVCGQCKNS